MTENHADEPIGWIGTGRMGRAMVSRLLAAGHRVQLWNRSPGKAADLAEAGAALVRTPADLASCRYVFMSLADGEAVEGVLFSEDGVLRADRRPDAVVDLSTVDLDQGEQLRGRVEELGVGMLSAPVSGNPAAVEAGKVVVAVSGPEDGFDAVRPYLETIGRHVTYLGEGDVARLVKVAHNLLLGVITQSLSEVTVMAEKGGVSRMAFLDFINSSVLGSTYTRYKTPAFVNLELEPTMTTVLLRKDFDAGLAAARRLETPMPVASLVGQLVGATVASGMRDLDFAALLLLQARSAGLDLKSEEADVATGL